MTDGYILSNQDRRELSELVQRQHSSPSDDSFQPVEKVTPGGRFFRGVLLEDLEKAADAEFQPSFARFRLYTQSGSLRGTSEPALMLNKSEGSEYTVVNRDESRSLASGTEGWFCLNAYGEWFVITSGSCPEIHYLCLFHNHAVDGFALWEHKVRNPSYEQGGEQPETLPNDSENPSVELAYNASSQDVINALLSITVDEVPVLAEQENPETLQNIVVVGGPINTRPIEIRSQNSKLVDLFPLPTGSMLTGGFPSLVFSLGTKEV